MIILWPLPDDITFIFPFSGTTASQLLFFFFFFSGQVFFLFSLPSIIFYFDSIRALAPLSVLLCLLGPPLTKMRGAPLPGPGRGNKRLPCEAVFAQRGVFSNSSVSQPCPADHTSVCTLAYVRLFGNTLKSVKPLNSSTVPAHSLLHRCVCVCVCVFLPSYYVESVCVCVWASVYCAQLCMFAPG